MVVEPGTEGLGVMLADLIRANMDAEPERARLLDEPGTVNLMVRDAEVTVGLRFTSGALVIGAPLGEVELSIDCTAETLMELTNVPLRFGMPDTLTPRGRAIAGKLLNGEIKVRGLPRHLPLMIRLQRLFTVA